MRISGRSEACSFKPGEDVKLVFPAAEDGEVAGGVVVGDAGRGARAVAENLGLDVAVGRIADGVELDARVGGQGAIEPGAMVARALDAEAPASMRQSPPVTIQSGPISARSKLSWKPVPSGGDGAVAGAEPAGLDGHGLRALRLRGVRGSGRACVGRRRWLDHSVRSPRPKGGARPGKARA